MSAIMTEAELNLRVNAMEASHLEVITGLVRELAKERVARVLANAECERLREGMKLPDAPAGQMTVAANAPAAD